MVRHLVILPDGSRWFSGTGQTPAIQSVSLTRHVNTGTEAEPGAVCAAMLEMVVLSSKPLPVEAGAEITLYRVDDAGKETKEGLFLLETPLRTGANRYSLTAYDRVSRLDRDLTQWLAALDQWPYTLEAFAGLVCQACGVTLRAGNLPNGSLPVPAFAAQGITGRQLMQWVGQLACRFCTADPEGQLRFDWYTQGISLEPGDCFQGSLQYAAYTVAPIEKVHLRLTQDAVGAVYPGDVSAGNGYTVTGNYLLSGMDYETQLAAAQVLFEQLQPFTYTPCKVTVDAGLGIRAGQLLTVTDKTGKTFTTCVMKSVRSGQSCRLESTGSATREASAAVNQQSFRTVSGKLMELRKSMEGLEMEIGQTITRTEGDLRQEIFTQNSAVISDCKQILLSALDSYTSTEDMEAFRQTVESQLSLLADQIQMNFTTVTERTEEVNGQLQTELTQLRKYFTFSADGLVIGTGDNAVELLLDSSGIAFRKNGVAFGYWDGNFFHTGNLVVNADETAQIGAFAFTSGSDGSLAFGKAGG